MNEYTLHSLFRGLWPLARSRNRNLPHGSLRPAGLLADSTCRERYPHLPRRKLLAPRKTNTRERLLCSDLAAKGMCCLPELRVRESTRSRHDHSTAQDECLACLHAGTLSSRSSTLQLCGQHINSCRRVFGETRPATSSEPNEKASDNAACRQLFNEASKINPSVAPNVKIPVGQSSRFCANTTSRKAISLKQLS